MRIENAALRPMLALHAADDPALDANRDAAGNRVPVIDLDVPCHRALAQGAQSLAHCLIQQCGDNSAMQVSGMALEIFAHGRKTHDGAVGRDQKLEVHPSGVGRATAEAAVLGRVSERLEMFL